KISVRSVPSLNMIYGESCNPAVKIVTLKFTVKTDVEGYLNDALLSFTLAIVNPSVGFVGALTEPCAPLALAVYKVGTEAMQKNLVNFPTMYNVNTGRLQPIFNNNNVIQEQVWIEVPVDTDLDGKRDLQRVLIRRPIETLPERGGLLCPVIASLTPYHTTGGTGTAFQAFSGRLDSGFPDQGLAPTRFSHQKYRDFLNSNKDVNSNRIYGPENDMSYAALKSVTDRVVGKGAEAHVARYKDLLEDGMLKATVYTPEQAANYPWLPPARVPLGKQLNGASATLSGSAGNWSAATYLPRGYAFVQVSVLGSDYAEGILQYGMYQESLCAAAVVDWLNGRIRGYADAAGTIEVEAYWASGEMAASGASFGGTLPIAAAITGVEGLRTIIPGAPVTLSYNYYRENGTPYAPGGYQGEDIFSTTYYCFGRGWNASSPFAASASIWDKWWKWEEYLMHEATPENGDYSPFWDERNPLAYGNDMRKDVGVIMGHGFNDDNVKFRNTAQYNEMLKYYGVEVIKGVFSQGGHGQVTTSSGIWVTTGNNLIDWTDYYLFGIDSDITERAPNYTIQSNLGSVWNTYDTFPRNTAYQKFYPAGDRVGALSLTPPQTVTPLVFKDELLPTLTRTVPNYETVNNGLAAHIRNNGWLDAAKIMAGEGGNLPSSGQPRWRNWIVGGFDSTTAWSSSTNRHASLSAGTLFNSLSQTKAINDRLLYLMDIPENFTISGFTKVTAEVAADKNVGVISAMLVEWGTTLKIVAMGSVDVRNPNPDGTITIDVPGLSNIEKGGNWHANYVFQAQNIIPYGTSTPTAANFNSYTWEMDVTEYNFSKGNKIGLILFGSDPFFTYRPRVATEFTVNIGPNTYLSLPVVNPLTVTAPAPVLEYVPEVIEEFNSTEIVEEIVDDFTEFEVIED
ncbi:MAG: hypothetical protein FWG61_02885, partial [Firmicutes bacterium]|nr:hypothetical protein [Bacillota bacterium]